MKFLLNLMNIIFIIIVDKLGFLYFIFDMYDVGICFVKIFMFGNIFNLEVF